MLAARAVGSGIEKHPVSRDPYQESDCDRKVSLDLVACDKKSLIQLLALELTYCTASSFIP